MAFHLEGPWLTTTGKQKGKRKWPSAEAKRLAEQRDADWRALLKKQGIDADARKVKRAMTSGVLGNGPRIPPGRETEYIASRDTGFVPCVKKADMVYSGTKVKGIGTLHKSNGVPIFSDEEAVDISRMRR
jgi:hypothetical protein